MQFVGSASIKLAHGANHLANLSGAATLEAIDMREVEDNVILL